MSLIKLDEDLPSDLIATLTATGHDAKTVHDQNLTGYADERLFPVVQSEKRWLFTGDKGFGDIRKFPPGSHHGIVLFRADRESRANYVKLVEQLQAHIDLNQCGGALIVVTFRGIRIVRPAP